MSKKETGWDDSSNEVQSNWVKFNLPATEDPDNADKVFGTLIAKRQIKSTMPGKEGDLVNVYELKGEEGHYHVLDDKKKMVPEAVEIVPGAFYSIGGTNVIDRQMQNIKVGQKIGLKYIEEMPSKTKGFAPAKVVKVFAPKGDDGSPLMDDEFLLENEFNGQ